MDCVSYRGYFSVYPTAAECDDNEKPDYSHVVLNTCTRTLAQFEPARPFEQSVSESACQSAIPSIKHNWNQSKFQHQAEQQPAAGRV